VLKKQLLDQYDAVCDDSKLLPLPRRPSAAQVLEQYVSYARSKRGGDASPEEDLCMGLQVGWGSTQHAARCCAAPICRICTTVTAAAAAAAAAGHTPRPLLPTSILLDHGMVCSSMRCGMLLHHVTQCCGLVFHVR
jgi:MRG